MYINENNNANMVRLNLNRWTSVPHIYNGVNINIGPQWDEYCIVTRFFFINPDDPEVHTEGYRRRTGAHLFDIII